MLTRGAIALAAKLHAPPPPLGMSQADLARRLGVSPQAVNGWLMGKALPSAGMLARLEDIAGIPMRAWTEESTGPSTETEGAT